MEWRSFFDLLCPGSYRAYSSGLGSKKLKDSCFPVREISTAHSCTVITAKALVVLLVLYLSSFVFCQFSCYCITKGALRTQLVYLTDNLSCNDIAAIWTNSNKAAVCWYLVHCQMHAYSYSTLISAYAN